MVRNRLTPNRLMGGALQAIRAVHWYPIPLLWLLSAEAMSRSIAVALDIDGVLLRGKKVLPRAADAVMRLVQTRTPFIIMSNGGGVTELDKAKELSEKLNISVDPRQILLAHTPLRSIVPEFSDKNVLLLGKPECLDIAQGYGFKHVYNARTLHAYRPSLCPQIKPADNGIGVDINSISAIINFHDPIDWALEMQVVSDILLEHSNVDYFSCNADILYSAEYHRPRYTQGAFNECLKHLLKETFHYDLHIKYFGKPFPVQYRYAENMLHWEANVLQLPPPQRYFGIGDNPRADIRGANNAGDTWSSVLVRTGMFSGNEANDKEDPADLVADDVLDAIEAILRYVGKT